MLALENKKLKIFQFLTILFACLLVTVLFVGAQSSLTAPTIAGGPYAGACDYTIFQEGSYYWAKNEYGELVSTTGQDAETITDSVIALMDAGTIRFGAGTFDFSGATITVDGPISIIGAGGNATVLLSVQFEIATAASEGVNIPFVFEDLTLQYSTYTASVTAIYASYVWGLRVSRCEIVNYETGLEIYATASDYAYGNIIDQTYFINCKYGIVLDRAGSGNSPNLNTVKHCRFSISSLLPAIHMTGDSSGILSTYNAMLLVDNNEFYGVEHCVQLSANIYGMSFINNYVEYQKCEYLISSDGTTRSLQGCYIMGNLVAQDTLNTAIFNDVTLTAQTMMQEIKPLLPSVNHRNTPLTPMTDAGGEWTVAFCKIASGTGISAGINSFYFNNTLLQSYKYPVYCSIIYNGGSSNQFTLTAEDYSHTGAGLESIRVQLTSSAGFTLGADFVFLLKVEFH